MQVYINVLVLILHGFYSKMYVSSSRSANKARKDISDVVTFSVRRCLCNVYGRSLRCQCQRFVAVRGEAGASGQAVISHLLT